MGAHHKCIKYIDEMLDLTGYDIGYRACQLGDCTLRGSAGRYLKQKYGCWLGGLSNYLIFCGFETVVMDINGRNKALPINLGIPIEDDDLLGSFDLIVAFAFAEHIEDQYELFKNIHNLCSIGGMVILNGPAVGFYSGHGTWKYDFWFFRNMLKSSNYKILDIRMMPLVYYGISRKFYVIYTSYSKTESSVFVDRGSFRLPHYDEIGHDMDKKEYGKYT
jgi:hypothetical protein